jgi:hypothetical protein
LLAFARPAPAIPSRAPLTTPPAPGFAPTFQTPRNLNMTEALRLAEALFGKVSTGIGPTTPRWNTFSGEMTPEGIAAALEQANAGIPYTFMDMSRRAVEQDALLGAVTEQRFAGVVSKQDRLEPSLTLTRDKTAISVANWLRAVREQVVDFNRCRYSRSGSEGGCARQPPACEELQRRPDRPDAKTHAGRHAGTRHCAPLDQ